MAREDHVSPLEDLSRVVIARGCCELLTTRAGEGWREKRGHHEPKRETDSLVRACHASMHGRWGRVWAVWRVSVEAKDVDEPTGEAHVVQKLTEKCRSRSKNFNSIT
jgi:hypothetical protein